MKLAELNNQITDLEKTNDLEKKLLEESRRMYIAKQTVTVGELLSRHEQNEKDHLSRQHWSSPDYYIRKYAEEIILEREN